MEIHIKKFNELDINNLYEILQLRSEVFVVKQNAVYQDLDDLDQIAIHFYLKENDEIKAYLRILPTDNGFKTIKPGRIIAKYGGLGFGRKILSKALDYAKINLNSTLALIDAQTYAKGFYEKFGFNVSSEEFILDGLSHVKMELVL